MPLPTLEERINTGRANFYKHAQLAASILTWRIIGRRQIASNDEARAIFAKALRDLVEAIAGGGDYLDARLDRIEQAIATQPKPAMLKSLRITTLDGHTVWLSATAIYDNGMTMPVEKAALLHEGNDLTIDIKHFREEQP